MNYTGDRVKDIKIAYIGGGSKGWGWTFMKDLALEEKLAGTVRLYDIDYSAALANQKLGNKLSARFETKVDWNYIALESLKETLQGADFIIISILPGILKEMESDVHLPEKYGIYQSVGDTVGPGGIIRALRTIPMFIELAEKIKKYSPAAWVINYTNPMSICMKTLSEVFPAIKAFGCCHEVFGTQELLAEMLKDMKGIKGVKRDEIKINVLGINHFTWIDEACYKGLDLFPVYRNFVDKYYETGYEREGEKGWLNSYFSSAERVKFDLFKKFGLIAAAGDRHLAEFVPSGWYLNDPETVAKWKFHLTPVAWRMKHKKKLKRKSKKLLKGEKKFELKESGEEGVRQIKALLGLEEFVTNTNIPNQGQVNGLPTGSIVETNALFGRDKIKPVVAGSLPPAIHNLVETHVLNQESVYQSVVKENLDLAYRAFLNDPLLAGLEQTEAERLFEEMIENTSTCLSWI